MRWKDLERDAARALGGQRVQRRMFEKAPDCIVPDLQVVLECKAFNRHAHHRLIETAQAKYCEHGEVALLITREPGRGAYVTAPLTWLAALLNELRNRRSAA